MYIRFPSATAAHANVELAAHACRRLELRMQHHSDRVDHIDVRLGDAGGRGPRHDSYCIVRVKLHGTPPATVVQVGPDVYGAIDRAVDRVCRQSEEQWRLAGSPRATPTEALAA